uniref:Uncharacterized protein n=1 Tax=Salix viminalis TaxID=40686 RepID=A0A6N2L7U2_SALVM
MSTNSLYHVKQASPFPGIPMIEYAEHEQFLLHSSSQAARLLILSTQAALEVSGRQRFLTQPPDPSLADHCSGYLGSNPVTRTESTALSIIVAHKLRGFPKKSCGEPFGLILSEKSPLPGSSADLHDVRSRSIPNFRSRPNFIPGSRRDPEEPMIGSFLFATHTTVFSGTLWYQIPRYRLLELPGLKNPSARKFVVTGLGPLGCIPAISKSTPHEGECAESINQALLSYNKELYMKLSKLQSQLYGSFFVHTDTFKLLHELKENKKKMIHRKLAGGKTRSMPGVASATSNFTNCDLIYRTQSIFYGCFGEGESVSLLSIKTTANIDGLFMGSSSTHSRPIRCATLNLVHPSCIRSIRKTALPDTTTDHLWQTIALGTWARTVLEANCERKGKFRADRFWKRWILHFPQRCSFKSCQWRSMMMMMMIDMMMMTTTTTTTMTTTTTTMTTTTTTMMMMMMNE